MKTMKGPAIYLAQFAGDAAPFNSLDAICRWAGSLGYEGVQVPSWDGRLFDLAKAAQSDAYCDEDGLCVWQHERALVKLRLVDPEWHFVLFRWLAYGEPRPAPEA